MSMLTEFAALAGALVQGRCFPVAAPDAPAHPYMVYGRVAAVAQNDLDKNGGADQLVNTRLQVNIFTPVYGDGQAVATALKAALLGWDTPNTVQMEMDQYEPDTKLHHMIIDLSIWHQ